MKNHLRKLSLILTFFISTAAICNAALLPQGSFKGSSSLIKGILNNDRMALLLKKDTEVADRYYAVLAEYDVIPLTDALGALTSKLALTKWVPRIYAYRVDKIDSFNYIFRSLVVTADGDISVRQNDSRVTKLVLKKANSMDGAVLTRYNKDAKADVVLETIRFKGKVGSTWEDYVPGTYFGTNENTGSDYFSKEINLELFENGIANFFTKEVEGEFDVVEKVPGLFTFKARSANIKGQETVVTKIGVFIDIVNWKPVATTDEMILIDPIDAKNVGFYYERH